MATTLSFKDYIDQPAWRPEAPALAVSGTGMQMCSDPRNNAYRNPFLYFLRSTTLFEFYDPLRGDWGLLPPLNLNFVAAGSFMVFHPSQGPRGTLAAGATTQKVVLSTALPSAVAANQLANRGDGTGFRIRIVGLASGKTEEKYIIANTSGTTPTLTLDSVLSFTPATGDIYEIRSGRIFVDGGSTQAANNFRYYDLATNFASATLSITNLPAAITTDSACIALSEDNVPFDRIPGDGFVTGGATYNAGINQCILATASSSTTVTGSGMPADLVANEYTNFQVRIVEDTTTPTSVGQRRRIASHTSGATGVFTVAAFAVTPSTSCKFVIENDDDKLILRTSANTTTYNYNITANTWDTTTWAAAPAANGTGNAFAQAYGPTRDTSNNFRHSFAYFFRGGLGSTLDVLDIAGGATGVWSSNVTYGNSSANQGFGNGAATYYDGATLGGKYLHIGIGAASQRMMRFDVRNRVLESGTYMRFPQGAAVTGNKLAGALFVDGATKLTMLYQITNSQAQMFSLAVPR